MCHETVSIIIPVYNSEKYIVRCLDSLSNQTYSNIEIILVNDGSTDKSENIIRKLSKNDDRIKLYNQINQGVSIARNTGLDKATGKYVMFVDADDYIELDMVEKLIKPIQHKNTVVFCDNTEIWSKKTDKRKLFTKILEKELNKGIVLEEIASGRAGLVCGKLFERNIVTENNIKFDKNVKVCEDQLFFLKIVSHCEHFIHIPEALYNYDRRNENSVTIRYQENALENQLYVLKHIEKLLSKSDIPIESINYILKNRYLDAVQLCINNEISDTKLSNINKRRKNIKEIISNDDLYKIVKDIPSTNIRTKIIKSGFKIQSAIYIHCSFFILDRIISPIRNLIGR